MANLTQSDRLSVSRLSKWLFIGAILVWAFWNPIAQIPFSIKNVPYALDYVSKMIPPDMAILPQMVEPLLETLQMAIVGTVAALVISLPISFLAARNTMPVGAISLATRGALSFLRSMPAMVWALLFVSLSGLGMLAGVLGITCHVTGALGKMFYECIEATGPKIKNVLEAMQIDGATRVQVIWYGIVPEIMPLVASYVLYRFESTIRTSTIMGMVGAGGLGLELTMAVRMFRRQEASAIILVILAFVLFVDWASGLIRKRIMESSGYV